MSVAGSAVPPPIEEHTPSFFPRAVALDVDGTLIDTSLFLHPRTREAVRAAAQRVPVVICTGRMYRSALPWAAELGVREPLICYQGALVREQPAPAGSGSVLFEQGLAPDLCAGAVRIAHENGWHVQAYIDDELLCDEDRPEAHLYAAIAAVDIRFVPSLEAAVAGGSTKIVVVSTDAAVTGAALTVFGAAFGSRVRVTRSLDSFIEVVDPRVSKASALDGVLRRHGLGLGDAVAVGDAGNDIEMIEQAGLGVAIRGARPEVLAAADATCAPPAEAGVADVLARVGLA
ncbi:MAG: HAD family hydrolase [Candidatus Dormibacteria bacterium]